MENIKSISENYKILGIFAFIGFILSFLIGLIYSTGIISTIIRSFLMGIMFLIVGFVVLFVLSIFVPEVYNILTQNSDISTDDNSDTELNFDSKDEYPEMNTDKAAESADNINNAENKADSEFKEVPVGNLSGLNRDDSQLNSNLSAAENGNLGKHIVVNDYDLEYEPKLMAQAVRTMLSKDEQ